MSTTSGRSFGLETERPAGPDDTLWQAIRTFRLDEPGTDLPFSRRLARDHLWTEDYAARVVEEYRRFLYLMATGIETVTPSEAVDEAWHLHLGYTRNYWDDLCGKVVRRPLHHDPTTGGPAEAARFRAAYDRTLLRYRIAFGMAPPSDIWPDTRRRFGPTAGFRTVALRHHWVLRRLWPRWVGKILHALGAVGAFSAGGVAAATFFPEPAYLTILGSLAGLISFDFAASALTGTPGAVRGEVDGDGDGDGGCSGCGGD